MTSPVAPVPAYAEPAVQSPLPGAPSTPRHIARTSRSFYPVGSRVGVFGSISAGFRLLPTCVAALMADPTLLFVPLRFCSSEASHRPATSPHSAVSPSYSLVAAVSSR